MSTSPLSHRPLTQLTREIEQAEAEASRLEAERAAVAKDARKSARRLRYLRLARAIRRPAAQLNLWPMALMLVGPTVVGILVLTVVHLLTNSYPAAFFGFLLGTVAGVGLFASLVYHPPDTSLPAAIGEAESQSRLANARLQEKIERLTEVKHRLQTLLDERRDWIASGKIQRATLLQLNWKAMRGYVWEDYLVQVCRTLGAKVERTGKCGDQGVDLIVEFGTRRIAVQAKGFDDEYGVNNKAVQEAYTGMACYKCDACAVITNTRFMKSATQSAFATSCILIGEDEFPDFVMGKIEL